MRISRLAVQRPVFTIMASLIVILLGAVAWSRLAIDLMPDITYPTLSISTDYENASPEEVEELISRLIPNTAVVEMIFPYFYYGRVVAPNPTTAIIQLIGYCLVFLAVLIVIYRQRVLSKQR